MIRQVIIGLFILIILGCCMLSKYKDIVIINNIVSVSKSLSNQIPEETVTPININQINNDQNNSSEDNERLYDNNLPLDNELNKLCNKSNNFNEDDNDLYGNINNRDPDELTIFDNY